MSVVEKRSQSDWVNKREYPFEPHYLDVDGGRLHYVDEGQGNPIVFVHGNPTWSFMFRRLIGDLSIKHRCIAPDHIGFGLSNKPARWTYSPEAHARNLSKLIMHLDLRNITLVMHDLGGPIGLSFALDNPGRVNSLVLMNTWMWSLREDKHAAKIDRFAKGPFGAIAYSAMNYAAAIHMPKLFAQDQKLTRAVHEHYKKPFSKPSERMGPHGMAKGLVGSSNFFYDLWSRRNALEGKPALILWGMKDNALDAEALAKWRTVFPNAQVETFPEAGHFVCEEQPNEVAAAVYLFVDGQHELHDTARAVNAID